VGVYFHGLGVVFVTEVGRVPKIDVARPPERREAHADRRDEQARFAKASQFHRVCSDHCQFAIDATQFRNSEMNNEE
jgi:hypothetical protein